MFSNPQNKTPLSATKKTRKSKKGTVHQATYYVKNATPNAGYSSASLKGSTEQLVTSVAPEANANTAASVASTRNVVAKTQASGGSGKPPISTGRSPFSATPHGPNPFTFLDQTAVPRAPKWGSGPMKHPVSTSLGVSNEAALSQLGASLQKVHQKFSSDQLKSVFSSVSS